MRARLEKYAGVVTGVAILVAIIICWMSDKLKKFLQEQPMLESVWKEICDIISKIVSGGIVFLWIINILLILYLGIVSIFKSIKGSNAEKSMNMEEIVNKVVQDFDLTDGDKAKICNGLLKDDEEQKESKGTPNKENRNEEPSKNAPNTKDKHERSKKNKLINTTSKEYWMSIWRVVYKIQKEFPEKGYLQYTNDRLKKQDKHIYDVFSDNNVVTIISLMFGALGIVSEGIAGSSLAIIIGLVVMVVLENYRSIIKRDDFERAENKLYREIIQSILNNS